MRYEFRWDLPTDDGTRELVLRISSITGWLGTKELRLDNTRLYNRGIFSGISYTITPRMGVTVPCRLRAAKSAVDGLWRPTVYAGEPVLPEKLGTPPPPVPRRPKPLAVTIGLTYLLIFIIFIMWLPIGNILSAAKSHTDSRVFVLPVVESADAATDDGLRFELPIAKLGKPYEARLEDEPSITWHRRSGRIPPGLTLDLTTGILTGTPTETGDFPIDLTKNPTNSESAKDTTVVIRVESGEPRTPKIVTEQLPAAVVGEPYSAPLEASGGKRPYEWICNSRKLPNGLNLKAPDDKGTTWQIAGTPTPPKADKPGDAVKSIAGMYAVRMRVNDDSYHASNDMNPWILPLAVTAVCLLGFWSMMRWSVFAFAAAIIIEIIQSKLGYLPVSYTAVALQILLLFVGIAQYKHMGRPTPPPRATYA